MAQLARRDVWIENVEVFELTKKTINFKETKGGIVLKNKKFLFDGGGEGASTVIVQDMMQVSQPQYQTHHYQQPQMQENIQQMNIQGQQVVAHPHNQGTPKQPVSWVVFVPELHDMQEIRQKNLRFTVDKKYPVFDKKQGPIGEIFSMVDDVGREQLVSDKYFVPANVNLFGDRELGFTENQQQRDGGNLNWGGAIQEANMPDIRR